MAFVEDLPESILLARYIASNGGAWPIADASRVALATRGGANSAATWTTHQPLGSAAWNASDQTPVSSQHPQAVQTASVFSLQTLPSSNACLLNPTSQQPLSESSIQGSGGQKPKPWPPRFPASATWASGTSSHSLEEERGDSAAAGGTVQLSTSKRDLFRSSSEAARQQDAVESPFTPRTVETGARRTRRVSGISLLLSGESG